MKRIYASKSVGNVLRHSMACAIGITLLTLASCSDDSAPALEPLKPQLPAAGGDALRSIEHQGDVTSCYDWNFSYDAGRLVSASGTIRNPDAEIDQSFSYTSSLSYSPNGIAMTNSSGETTQVTLNSQGYIERMTVNRNVYYFSYTDGRLSGWSKTAVENSLGQVITYYSSATIEYQNGNFSRLVYTGTDNSPVTLTFAPATLQNRNGLLPEAIGRELGCLGFEHLYYAGLLGRPTVNLVKSISSSSDKDASKNYTIDFEYSTRNGNTVLCNYHTPEGGVASVTYGY